MFLQFPVSLPLWNLLPKLRFLQFPWRWLVVVEAPMAIFFASAVWPANSARPWRRFAVLGACIAVFAAMTTVAARSFFQPCDDEDAVPGMLNTYSSGQGVPGTDEYAAVDADDAQIATGLPAACLVTDPDLRWERARATRRQPGVAAGTGQLRPDLLRIAASGQGPFGAF